MAEASCRFSRIDRLAKMFSVCGTKAMPRRMIWFGLRPVTGAPSRRTSPPNTGTVPATAFTKVDLPAPLGPRIATISPSATEKSIPLTMGRSRS